MDRNIDIISSRSNENKEVTEFLNELKNSINNEEIKNIKSKGILYKNLCDEILEETALAQKYRVKLNKIVNECMKNESYESDFIYINYDNSKNAFTMNYYNDGKIEKTELTPKDIKDYNYKVGMTYEIGEDDTMVEAKYLKDSIKIDVNSALNSLERENRNNP